MKFSTSAPGKTTKDRSESVEAVMRSWACEQLLALLDHSRKKLRRPLNWNEITYNLCAKDIGRRTVRNAVDSLAAAGLVKLTVNADGSLLIGLAGDRKKVTTTFKSRSRTATVAGNRSQGAI